MQILYRILWESYFPLYKVDQAVHCGVMLHKCVYYSHTILGSLFSVIQSPSDDKNVRQRAAARPSVNLFINDGASSKSAQPVGVVQYYLGSFGMSR
jgi:hypothetical protein